MGKVAIDLDKKRFGRLTATNRMRRVNGKLLRVCLCDCGTFTAIPTARLRSGHTKSCGCWKKDFKKLKVGAAARNEVLDDYKRGAAKRGLAWNISDELFDGLVCNDCWYCGASPSNERKSRRNTGSFTYNGIDRMQNDAGYEPGNCVSCCSTCNKMKSTMCYGDFLTHVRRIVENQR